MCLTASNFTTNQPVLSKLMLVLLSIFGDIAITKNFIWEKMGHYYSIFKQLDLT